MDFRIYIGVALIMQVLQVQAWKFGRKQSFRYCAVSIINKRDGSNNLFPQIHLHNTNAFFEDLMVNTFTIWLKNFTFYILIFQNAAQTQTSVFFHNNSATINLSRMLSYAVYYKETMQQ